MFATEIWHTLVRISNAHSPVKNPAAPSNEYKPASGSCTMPVCCSRCAHKRPMHEPRNTIGEKLPEGIARPDVHAAKTKYTGTNNISDIREKSLYAIDHIDLMLSPAQLPHDMVNTLACSAAG